MQSGSRAAAEELDMATVHVPQASCQIEVSSADTAGAEHTVPVEVARPEPAAGGRSVVLVRRSSCSAGQLHVSADGDADSAASPRGVKYVLTGLPGSLPQLQDGASGTSLRSPAAYTVGQSTKASRARQILKKRQELSQMEKKYIRLLYPSEETASAQPPTPVMICEPENMSTPKTGRTLFFVAKPLKEEPKSEAEQLADSPAQSAADDSAQTLDNGVLKKLTKYRLSEKYEILPPSGPEAAEDIIHRLRVQNLSLKTELLRSAMDSHADVDELGLKTRRGRKKPTTLITVDRLRELEKIEAGMHSLFTPSQVKVLSREYKKNSVQWKDEDFRRALGLLEASSVRAFNYIRKEMNVPLPSIGTLKLRCPLQPELNDRLMAVLEESIADPRCQTCSRQLQVAQQAALAGEDPQAEYQELTTIPPEHVGQPSWTPNRGVLKRRKRGGGVAKKARMDQEPTVYFEDPAVHTPLGNSVRGRGRGRGRGKRAPPEPEPDPEPETVSEEEFGDDDEYEEDEEEGEELEVDEQQEVPVEFARLRSPYTGWSEWDPRQLQ